MRKIISLLKGEIGLYLFFGILTTLVNIICFQVFGLIFGKNAYLLSNAVSWVIAVAFAYVTNKIWVFKSKSWSVDVIKTEMPAFLSARVFSLILEEIGLWLMIDIFKFEKFSFEFLSVLITGSLIAKLIMQVIVVLSNYIFSKFLIFKNKK